MRVSEGYEPIPPRRRDVKNSDTTAVEEPSIAAGRRDRGAPAAGLRYDPPLTLTDYADTQAKWYYRLKRENSRARAEGRPFANPVEPRPLKWRS